ncbi:MAG TPA: O-antigen ligase family protein [Thermoanaerobaculia bacterium]|nr:O-antigen ligase family protein [Thermoanaerobaculia bacterium]
MTSAHPTSSRPARVARRARIGYWLFSGHLLTLFGIALSNILLALTLLTAPWTLRGRRLSWAELAPMAPLLVPLGVYALWLVGSIVASFDPATSVSGLRELFTLSALLVAPLFVRGERDVRRLVDALVVIGALLAGTGLAQYLVGYGGIDRRIRGPFSHYMTFSGLLLICDLLLIASMILGARRQAWRWVALLVINTALLGSLTRSAWVGLGLTLTLYLLLRTPRWLLAYVPAAIVFAMLAPPRVLERVSSITDLRDRSNYDRLCMLEAGAAMVAERPWFGMGPEMVERRYAIYRPASAPRYEVPHLHNSFLQLAAERGLPELAAYLALLAGAAVVSWRRYVREGGDAGPRADLYVGMLLALLAFNLAGLFENNWGDTEVQRSALFLLAIPFCLETIGNRTDRPDRSDRSDPVDS